MWCRNEKFHNNSYCFCYFALFTASITIYVHKCADQSHKTMVQDTNGEWNWGRLFQRNLFNEGCFPHTTKSMLTTSSVNCFCSTDLCNGARSRTTHPFSALVVVTMSISAIFTTTLLSRPNLIDYFS